MGKSPVLLVSLKEVSVWSKGLQKWISFASDQSSSVNQYQAFDFTAITEFPELIQIGFTKHHNGSRQEVDMFAATTALQVGTRTYQLLNGSHWTLPCVLDRLYVRNKATNSNYSEQQSLHHDPILEILMILINPQFSELKLIFERLQEIYI